MGCRGRAALALSCCRLIHTHAYTLIFSTQCVSIWQMMTPYGLSLTPTGIRLITCLSGGCCRWRASGLTGVAAYPLQVFMLSYICNIYSGCFSPLLRGPRSLPGSQGCPLKGNVPAAGSGLARRVLMERAPDCLLDYGWIGQSELTPPDNQVVLQGEAPVGWEVEWHMCHQESCQTPGARLR